MKKIFVLIVFMAVVINANAQYFADGHHMTYRGVSFAESLQAFRQKLSAKKLEFTHNDPKDLAYLIGEYTSGALDGDLATISYDEKNGRITKISVSTFDRCLSDAKPKFVQLLTDIRKAYPNAVFENVVAKNEWGSRMEKYCWNVLSPDKEYMLGSVYVTLDMNDDDPHYCATMTITDAYNCMLAEDVVYGYDDISYIMSPKYDACYMFLDEDNLVVYPVKNKTVGMVLITSDDRRKILELLYDGDRTEAEKRKILSDYFDSMPIFNKQFLCMTEGSFDNEDVYWGIRQDPDARVSPADVQQQNVASSQQQSAPQVQGRAAAKLDVAKSFREWMFDGIMGKDLVDFYKSNGTYDLMVGIMGGLMKVVGGNEGYKTSWDSYSDAQKAVIHEHDNAR